jgi:hypothetical protein
LEIMRSISCFQIIIIPAFIHSTCYVQCVRVLTARQPDKRGWWNFDSAI